MKWNKNKSLVAASIVIGLISGTLRPLFLADYAQDDLTLSLYRFVTAFDIQNIGFAALFESFARYSRILLLIWACAALPKAHYVALLVLYMRAMALTFSAVMMVTAFGGRGLAYALALYGLQNTVIMPIYAYTVYFIIENRLELAVRSPENLIPTIRTAAVGLAAVLAASAIETYIVPTLFALIWR